MNENIENTEEGWRMYKHKFFFKIILDVYDKDAVKLLLKQTDVSFDNINSMLNSTRRVQPVYVKS